MAGAGYKLFNTGDVLTAAQVNTYLMQQTVMVFADASARTTALTGVVAEGMISFLKDTNSTEYYSGSAWVAVGGSVPTSYGFTAGKNSIMNGDFSINQRNFTSATTNVFGFDRWGFTTAGGTGTYSTQAFAVGTAVGSYSPKNYCRIVTTGQSSSSDLTLIAQRIENVATEAGQTVVVSFYAKAATGTPKIAVELAQGFGTGGSPSAEVDTYLGQATLTTSWARYSLSVTVPSISGKTLGTDNNNWLSLNLWVSAGSTYNSRTGSLGLQSATFDIWGVQLEAGSTATEFQTATGIIQGELAACQRYYTKTYAQGTAPATATSTNIMASILPTSGTGSFFLSVRFPVTMRGTPTITAYDSAGASGKVYKGADGKTAVTQQFGDAGGRIGTSDATNTNELLFHYTADAEL
jgi:hypothetical protein